MEEDEADNHSGTAVLEKGAAEEGKEEDDDGEEEEGGITFQVPAASTPAERRDQKHIVSTLPAPPNTVTAPTGAMSSHSSSQSSQPIPKACATIFQPQSQTGTSTPTAASSSGKCFLTFSLNI